MKKLIFTLMAMGLLMPTTADAQRRKKSTKTTRIVRQVAPVAPPENPLKTQMLEAVQQIIFIDSMVVDKDDFMKYIPLSDECGTVSGKNGMGLYVNEFGDYRIGAKMSPADSLEHLMTSEKIGMEWTEEQPVQGLGEAPANFPYLMPDGITLYYAQKGEKSLGGYDIFVTRYDAESGSFLKAENLGMPFASESNDYFYAIDEKYQLGYFVSDRKQPEDKVCIYIFVPNETRKIYTSENYMESQLQSLGCIENIADTWDNSETRMQAIGRYERALAERKITNQKEQRKSNSELDNLRQQASVLETALTKARNYFATASRSEQNTLRKEILKSEQDLEKLQQEIYNLEKKEIK